MNALTIILGTIAVIAAPVLIVFLIGALFRGLGWMFRGIGWFIAHVFSFIGGMFLDAARLVGALLTASLFVPLVIANIAIGRWSASAHFGRELQHELATGGACVYRLFVGRPARLLLLDSVTEGIERRLPDAIARAPGADKPAKKTGRFDGYEIVGSLRGGGSGGKLYIAEPDEIKRAAFARMGVPDVDKVVIKSFSIQDGSSLPQIIRESRALEAARRLQLVLDHELTDERFHYVMPYVPGEDLTRAASALHERSGPDGLTDARLREGVGYVMDLLEALSRYHRGGLWHKDIKPDNIIVSGGKAHLVDLGLVTPLRSAMTLTTHGTEYFRDPELVRLALRGAKVHEVDGVKFDIYGAGAVLYAVIENSFPAHGGLSQIQRRCPESLRWIVRRAMADLNRRYATVEEMLADLRVVASASEPFSVKPADLPSLKGGGEAEQAAVAAAAAADERWTPYGARESGAATVEPARHGPEPRGGGAAPDEPASQQRRPFDPVKPRPVSPADRPRLRPRNWLTGGAVIREPVDPASPAPPAGRGRVARSPRPVRPARPAYVGPKRSAAEIRDAARHRVDAARARARDRMARHRRRSGQRDFRTGPNVGVAVALFLFLGACIFVGGLIFQEALRGDRVERYEEQAVQGVGADAVPPVLEMHELFAPAADPRAEAPAVAGEGDDPEHAPEPTGEDAALDRLATAIRRVNPADAPVLVLVRGVDHRGVPLRDTLAGLPDRLARVGIPAFGLGGETDAQLDLVAQAERVVALRSPTSGEAFDELREWVASTDGVGLVLWASDEVVRVATPRVLERSSGAMDPPAGFVPPVPPPPAPPSTADETQPDAAEVRAVIRVIGPAARLAA